ncbi:uncharacterized protein LOC131883383 [Tigriopus californicus]|uniref:uncharacterized protein LOC131883383 n=1 Tax=Tigriopus californicus TaxID=6832 RepID=UPI0027DA0B8D|nr:uncharacterized protein LOC131883383 [Tigriopus californicus]
MSGDEYFHCFGCKLVFKDLKTRRNHVKGKRCSAVMQCVDDPENVTNEFNSIEQAKDWAFAQEWDRYFFMRSSSKTSVYFRCNQSNSVQVRQVSTFERSKFANVTISRLKDAARQKKSLFFMGC